MTFKSVLALCFLTLCIGFFTLDFFKTYTRYQFLITGEICIALDRKEDALKFISPQGSIVVPLTKSLEDKMRDKLESELTNKIQTELAQKNNMSQAMQNQNAMMQ